MTTPQQSSGGDLARRASVGLLVVLTVIAALAAGLWLGRASDGATPHMAVTAQNIDRACRGWVSDERPAGVDDRWCGRMGSWLSRADTPMMGTTAQRTWDEGDLTAACRRWSQRSGNGGDDWCDRMIGWMRDHMSSSRMWH
jgi:hypothetical protein